jgi:hypothetical protein
MRNQNKLVRKAVNIRKRNTTFVKDVNVPTDCIGSRKKIWMRADLENTIHSKSRLVSD